MRLKAFFPPDQVGVEHFLVADQRQRQGDDQQDQQDVDERREVYRQFFQACRDWTAGKGKLSLQTIAYSERTKVQPLLDKTFPDSDLPLEWEPIAAAEGTFSLIAARNDADHYYQTLVLWEQNLLAYATEHLTPEERTRYRAM